MRFLLPATGFVLLLMACGGDSVDFREPTPTGTALGASVAPGGGTIAPATPTQCAKQYTIASGDTLSAVAAAQKVELQALIDANGITDPSTLSIGQQIIIPCVSSVAVTPVATTATVGP